MQVRSTLTTQESKHTFLVCICMYCTIPTYVCTSNVMFKIKVSHPHLDKAPSLTNYGYGVKTTPFPYFGRSTEYICMYNYIGI